MKPIRFFHFFSLDVAAGAAAGSYLFARLLGIQPGFMLYLLMFLSAFVIYSADHMIDGIRKKGETRRETHRFFYNYRIPVSVILLFLGIFIIRLAFYILPRDIALYGLVLGGIVLVYYVFNIFYQETEHVMFIKELWIALIYSFAVVGMPLAIYDARPGAGKLLLFVAFGMLVLINVLIYSFYEIEEDKRDREKSLATVYGAVFVRRLIFLLLGFSLLLLIFSFVIEADPAVWIYLVLLLMTAGLGIIIFFPSIFRKNSLYGMVADALFLLPLLLLPVQ